ncbi:MAG TPA: Hpt domain-containing protein [Puia sp.]|nr:Hpt domain-containing protein [Puia sp.]
MEQPLSDRTFRFSDAINSQYIIELYAGDYVMIEETFADVLHEYDGFVQRIITSYQEKDRPALKSAVHKIKPLFGFVGLTALQSRCLQFENSCLEAADAPLESSFSALREQLLEARGIIEHERSRLTDFNRQ